MLNAIKDLIQLNCTGNIIELCQKYYASDITMISNGTSFANSRQSAIDNQKGYIDSVDTFDITLISKEIDHAEVTLVFHYKMICKDGVALDFTGEHVQTWENNKIIKEIYTTLK